MSDDSIDDLGPVDYLVVEFPADRANFTGEMASELTALVDAGTIRVLDLLILRKDADGAIEALEIDDVDGLDEIRRFESDIAEILAADDVADLAASMENGSTAFALVWENSGRHRSPQLPAAPAGSWSPTAVSRSKRSRPRSRPSWPTRVKEPDMPLRPARAVRRGVIGAPVARTVAVVGTAKVVSNGIDRRQDRREDRRDNRKDRRS